MQSLDHSNSNSNSNSTCEEKSRKYDTHFPEFKKYKTRSFHEDSRVPPSIVAEDLEEGCDSPKHDKNLSKFKIMSDDDEFDKKHNSPLFGPRRLSLPSIRQQHITYVNSPYLPEVTESTNETNPAFTVKKEKFRKFVPFLDLREKNHGEQIRRLMVEKETDQEDQDVFEEKPIIEDPQTENIPYVEKELEKKMRHFKGLIVDEVDQHEKARESYRDREEEQIEPIAENELDSDEEEEENTKKKNSKLHNNIENEYIKKILRGDILADEGQTLNKCLTEEFIEQKMPDSVIQEDPNENEPITLDEN